MFTPRIGRRRIGVLAALVATVASSGVGRAAPVTFAFAGKVVGLSEGPGFTLPMSVQVGDEIHGRFSFEPAPRGRFGLQQAPLQIEIGGVKLETAKYGLTLALRRDGGVNSGLGEVHQTPEFRDFAQLGYFDQIFTGLPLVPGTSDVTWRPDISFGGPSPVFPENALSGDLSVWNTLIDHSIAVNFVSSVGVGHVYAGFGPLIQLPEPQAVQMTACWALTVGVAKLRGAGEDTKGTGPRPFGTAFALLHFDLRLFLEQRMLRR